MASFLINTKAEMLKSRRTLAYRITFFAGISLPVLFMLAYILRPDVFTKMLSINPWEMQMKHCWEMGSVFFPMFVTILTSLVVQNEYRNNTWKNVYTQPRGYADIFFSKFAVIQLLMLASLLFMNLAMVTTAYIANIFHGAYGFFGTAIPIGKMLSFSVHIYLASLAVSVIQYWLSMRFKNYVTSMGIGIGLTIAGLVMLNWDKSIYWPYLHPLFTYMGERKHNAQSIAGIAKHEWYSIIYAAVLLPLSFLSIVSRKERG